jgi:transcriptional regulator with XRE-family HTH domain
VVLLEKEIGQKLYQLRNKYGYSMRKVGEGIGVDYSYISRLEKGEKTPSLDVLQKLADFFNVKISYFFGEEVEMPKELKDLGVEWITLSEEMKNEGLSVEDVRKAVNFIKKFKNEFGK